MMGRTKRSTHCRAAVAKWEENGADALARRGGGLKPETLVRSIEK